MKIPMPSKIVKIASRLFDLEATSASAEVDMRTYEYSFVLARLMKLKMKQEHGVLADIGCTARMNPIPATMCELGWRVWGIDIRDYGFKHSNFQFIKKDIAGEIYQSYYVMKSGNYPPEFFDAITAVSTLEHLGMSGRYGIKLIANGVFADNNALDNIYNMLKTKGTFIMTVPYTDGEYLERDGMRVYPASHIENKLPSNRWDLISVVKKGDKGNLTIMIEAMKK